MPLETPLQKVVFNYVIVYPNKIKIRLKPFKKNNVFLKRDLFKLKFKSKQTI